MQCIVRIKFCLETSKEEFEALLHMLPEKPNSSKNSCLIYEIDNNVDFGQKEVEILLDKVDKIKDFLLKYTTQLDIIIYTEGQTNPGFHITAESLKRLAKYNASIDLDIYKT